jgi:hypothetical protein
MRRHRNLLDGNIFRGTDCHRRHASRLAFICLPLRDATSAARFVSPRFRVPRALDAS